MILVHKNLVGFYFTFYIDLSIELFSVAISKSEGVHWILL